VVSSLCLCLELVSYFSLLYACALNYSHPGLFFMPVSWIGLRLFSSLCLCLELVSFFSLLYACVLNWSYSFLFFMHVPWISFIIFSSLCLCRELVSYYSLLYACVLNWSFLFFTPAFWISLILLFIRNRNVCLCHSMLLLTLIHFLC